MIVDRDEICGTDASFEFERGNLRSDGKGEGGVDIAMSLFVYGAKLLFVARLAMTYVVGGMTCPGQWTLFLLLLSSLRIRIALGESPYQGTMT